VRCVRDRLETGLGLPVVQAAVRCPMDVSLQYERCCVTIGLEDVRGGRRRVHAESKQRGRSQQVFGSELSLLQVPDTCFGDPVPR
jgi:hypothetical protein